MAVCFGRVVYSDQLDYSYFEYAVAQRVQDLDSVGNNKMNPDRLENLSIEELRRIVISAVLQNQ